MQIKKFIAPTLKEASAKMKDELGGEAVILGTRVIYDHSRGSQKMFEITAGIEEPETVPEYAGSSDFDYEIRRPQRQASSKGRVHAAANYGTQNKPELPEELRRLSERIFINPSADLNMQKAKVYTNGQSKPKHQADNNIENEIKEIVASLFYKDLQKPVVASLVNQLKKYKGLLQKSNISSYVLSGMASMIPTYHFEVQKNNKPKVVALVGPTGVGKTTCIAKLAVISKILHNLSVGLISIDTYRLGALDQLRIFSEISNVDMLVAYEPRDVPGLMNSFKNKDIIFIDTAGRSQNNKEQLINAKEFLNAANVEETYLVLSSTGTSRNLLDVAKKFKVLNYNSVIFTKIDEAVTFGNILNVVSAFNIPVSFLTNGQVIPDDIISADPEFIANMIYTGKIN